MIRSGSEGVALTTPISGDDMRLRFPALISLILLATLAPASGQPFDPLRAYGEGMEFEVLRDGSPVGRHTVRFSRDGEDLIVDVDMKVAISILGITVYRFGYRSEAVWRDGLIQRLDAFIDDDGKQKRIEAVSHGDAVTVDGPNGAHQGGAEVLPTNHWNPAVQGRDRVLNTLTGRIASVAITAEGSDEIETNRGRVRATRFAYSGDLHDIHVWYDDQGRWVQMRFIDKRGGTMEYRCVRCGRAEPASK